MLFGEAADVTPSSFTLDSQIVLRNENTVYYHGLEEDLQDGSFIQVIAQIDNPNSNDFQFTALEISFIDGEPPFDDYVQLEGTISELSQDHLLFMLQDEMVEISEQTFIIGTTIEELDNGLNVIVEGFRNQDNDIIEATFMLANPGDPTDPGGHVCISGTIVTVNNDQTQITLDNGGVINLTQDTEYFGGTQADLEVGTYVDISGIVNEDNSEIEAEVVFFEQNNPDSYVFFNGFITAVADDLSQITVDETIVNITNNTVINGGSINNLVVGIEVQVDGLYNSNSDEVDAEFISIPITSVGASAPVLPSDITLSDVNASNGVIIIMGIEVHQNELTWDFSEVFINGLASEQTVAFFGYQDNEGVVWASVIFSGESDNNPNGGLMNGLFLQGKIQTLSENNLNVQGVNIGNLDGAVYLDEFYQEITAQEFFDSASEGDPISIADAQSYERDDNTLNAGVISLEYNQGFPQTQNRAAGNQVNGTGVVTEVIQDVIFKNIF